MAQKSKCPKANENESSSSSLSIENRSLTNEIPSDENIDDNSKMNHKFVLMNHKTKNCRIVMNVLFFFVRESDKCVVALDRSPSLPSLNSAEIDENVISAATSSNVQQANDSTPTSLSFNDEMSKYIEIFSVERKNASSRQMRCKVCCAHPSVVKLFCSKTALPAITTEQGCRYRTETMKEHFKSRFHGECKKAESLKTMQLNQSKQSIDFHIGQANKQQADHIGKLAVQIFTDGKKLTLSAWTWPARYVTAEVSHNFDFNKNNEPTIPKSIELQYVNPNSHLELMSAIVKSHHDEFEKKLDAALAISIRIDGSVDRTKKDKIYIMLKLTASNGENELLLLGIGVQTERGAAGLMNAVKKGIKSNVSEQCYKQIFVKISSICTDGTNMNSGEKAGLWKLFEDEIRKEGSSLILLKIWCAAHRMDLVWDDVTDSHVIISKTLNILSSIASYFNQSGLRMADLQKIADENGIELMSLPKIFEIRWTEFTHTLVHNVLRSWHALVLFFSSKKTDATCSGFAKFLTKFDNLKTIAFLADILSIFQRYHKKVQSNTLTLLTLVKHLNSLKVALASMNEKNLIGGWEEVLQEQVVIKDELTLLKGIPLQQTTEKQSRNGTDFEIMKRDIVQFTIERLSKRFDTDFDLNELIEPFVNFNGSANIRQIHSRFAPDLNLMSLSLQYDEITNLSDEFQFNDDLQRTVKILMQDKNYEDIVTVLARIAASTPHSADVERAISANNLLKTALRNNMSLETEQKYLYIYFNMPTLEEWDPRKAVTVWLNEKKRRTHTNLIEKKATHAEYYKGIFNRDISKSADESETLSKKVSKIRF